MAHFLGSIRGRRGEATRLGSKRSGLRIKAASWQGAVVVFLHHNEVTGRDMAEISFQTHHDGGTSRMIYSGPVDGS
jgi:hypothetical protein